MRMTGKFQDAVNFGGGKNRRATGGLGFVAGNSRQGIASVFFVLPRTVGLVANPNPDNNTINDRLQRPRRRDLLHYK